MTAADGLPTWAAVTPIREAHIERVVALLDHWADQLQLPVAERQRWKAAGWLHDALRDATDTELVRWSGRSDLPIGLLHGPAAARRAEAEGETDRELLDAVALHTVGSADWGDLGLALYAADFLEPGRPFDRERRAELAQRFPDHRDEVIREILTRRMNHIAGTGRSARPETLAFRALWL